MKNILERIERFGEGNNLIGVSSQPETSITDKPCVILLNAGLINRIGPNRIYVSLSRKLADYGFITLRIDLGGIGESVFSKPDHESELNNPHLKDVKNAMDLMEKQYGTSSFIIGGLCTGAELSYHSALLDERVVGIIPINGTFLNNENFDLVYPIAKKQIFTRYYQKNIFSQERILKNLSKLRQAPSKLKKFINAKFSNNDGIEVEFKTIADDTLKNFRLLNQRMVKQLLIFSEGSEAYYTYKLLFSDKVEFEHQNIKTDLFKDVDHVFTQRYAQLEMMDVITNWCRSVSEDIKDQTVFNRQH